MESIENIKDRFIIQTPEDAINFFGIENENEKMFVQALFEIAPLKPDGDGKNNPFVGNYSSKSNFALRRWAQDNPNVNDLMNKYNIKDFNSLGSKNKKFGGYHNDF